MDKKLKKAAEKITMSDQLRDRILDQCNNASTKENDGSIEISGVEHVEHKPISRIVAAAAACAVLAGGVGMTAHLLNRNGAPSDEIGESSETDPTSESEESAQPWDFSQIDYTFTNLEQNKQLESTDQLTAFLCCMDWGEKKDPDIYSGFYDYMMPTYCIEFTDENGQPCNIAISQTVATPPEEGETGIARFSHSDPSQIDYDGDYYAFDYAALGSFILDEEERQNSGNAHLFGMLAGRDLQPYGWGAQVEADKYEMAQIGEVLDSMEFTPLYQLPEEAGQDSGEAWHFMLDPSELVIFPSGTAIYHKNERNTDNSLTNIYNTYYQVDFDAIDQKIKELAENSQDSPSMNTDEVLMPDLVGMQHELAEDQLRQRGINFEKAYVETDQYQPDYITQTIPAPGEPIEEGGTVTIYITMNSGSAIVDDLIGMKEEDAATMANYSGLKVIVEYAPGYSPQGTVIGQSLPANEPVDPGSEITLTVSTGEPSTLENFPPFGNLYKMGCFINGSEFASGNETSCIVSDILSRYDWSSEETVTELYKDAEVLYIIDTIVNEAHRIVYFYNDGTVEWLETQDLAANNIQVHRYSDIDGENNDLVFQLRQVLDELMPYNQLTE
ncbi:MAG: PASTA domain-containing protein [Ruminococcus sp.]|nr:PASTA domain-containing protein [Ruminococcus sp.]